MKKVTIVIPNYNGKHFLKVCLDSLQQQSCQDFSVLLVDNASTDGSVELVREFYPEVDIRVMEENLGFSGGVNYGIRHSKTPFVLLLNNDTQSHPEFVGELLKAIEKSEKIFSVSSCMINFNERSKMDDAGDVYSLLGWAVQRGVGRDVEKYQEPKRIFSACAGAAIYRRQVFDEIGLFDECHFAYLEDVDLGYRANIYGYRNMYTNRAKVYHVGSGTSGSKYNEFKVRLAARNNIYLNYKNMPMLQLLLNSPFLVVGMAVKYAFFRKKGFGHVYWAGTMEGIKTCRRCKRVVYQSNRFWNYVDIQMQLIEGTFVYFKEYFARKAE